MRPAQQANGGIHLQEIRSNDTHDPGKAETSWSTKKNWFFQDKRALANLAVILIAISFYLAVSHFDSIRAAVSVVLRVIMPFLVGFAFAYLLNGPTDYFEEKVFGKLKCRRGLAVLTVYALAIALLAVLVKLILPADRSEHRGALRMIRVFSSTSIPGCRRSRSNSILIRRC